MRPSAASWLARTACVAGIAVAMATGASAQPVTQLWIAGLQLSPDNSYSYLGWLRPVWGGSLGRGWYHKTVGSWLTYRYDTDHEGRQVEVRARAPGVETGLGHVWQHDSLQVDLSVSAGVRHTRRRPDVASEGPGGTQLTLTPQLSLRQAWGPRTDGELLASYSFGTRGRFARARLGWRPQASWRGGVEASIAAGPDYRNDQIGLFAGRQVAPGLTLDFNAGRAHARDSGHSAYLGVAASKTF